MRRKVAVLTGMLVVCGTFLIAQRERAERPVRLSVRGTKAAIATGSDYAAEAGMRVLHAGGNAVDAGIAAMFAASVSEYSHFGFGGEAPILIRSREGKVASIAGIGTMPKLATADYFRTRRILQGELQMLEPDGLKAFIPVAGLMPALVPGMVDAALLSLKEFGTISFEQAVAPAIELADGTPLDETRAGAILRNRRFFELWPVSKATYFPPDTIIRPGEIFRQPNLAKTMRSMVEAERRALKANPSRTAAIDAVRDFFYRGEIARAIDAFSKAHGGLLRYEDMAAFRLKTEAPVVTNYHGYQVYKPGFWSQGPVMVQTLNIIEGFDLGTLPHNSTEYLHKLAEALKLAYADRDTYYGDPNFAKIPAERLLSKEYAASRRALVTASASLDFRPGRMEGPPALHPSQSEMAHARIDDALMARDTTGINVIDRNGLMFAATPSGAWLPSVVAGDTGIPLTQRAQSFLLTPGHPNELAGGKRPRITLSPTIVTRDGRPAMTLSTPGGDNQDQSLVQILLNVIEFRMNAQNAIEAPRFQTRHLVSSFDNHAMNRGDLLLDERIPPATFAELTDRGHKTATRPRWNSGAHPVLIRVLPNGVIEAGVDPWGFRTAQAW